MFAFDCPSMYEWCGAYELNAANHRIENGD